MLSEKMMQLGKNRSVIRDLFEFGNKRKAEIGEENVFDFSIGNPGVPAPDCIKEAALELLDTKDTLKLHGYTSAQGDFDTRKAICDYTNKTHGTKLTPDNFFMTCGAAASLTITLKALSEPEDEFITFAPFFPEYRVFVEGVGSKLVVCESRQEDFQIDIDKFEKAITKNTKGVIINSPNNPSGVVLTEQTIEATVAVLKNKEKEYGHPIFLIADEPYRELVYGDVKVPYLMNYYDNTIVCYSYSKSFALAGERIGYIAVSDKATSWQDIYAAIAGAARVLGYVCAPSMFQKIVQKCVGEFCDISFYKENRDILVKALTEYGYRVIQPDGAFYLFVEAFEKDANKFSMRARDFELLLVPADSFGTPGYVRISYSTPRETVVNSLPAFEKLAKTYGKC